MRRKRLLLNTITAILYQFVTLVCGFVLPKMIINNYGSATNGLITSITQFLAFFSLMDMGVGAVVRASLYKPLADNDDIEISKVLIASKRFFNKIGFLLCGYSAILMIFFPVFISHSIGYIETAILVFACALSSISYYMIGIVYAQLLNADQRSYVRMVILSLVTILNTVFVVVLINLNAPIHIAKLIAALIVLLRPFLLKLYCDRHYKINFQIELTEEPLKQKWNGLAQHLAQYILKHADTVVLTFMSTLENVSIYSVYHLITNGLLQMVEILTTGIQALFGNMYAMGQIEKLNKAFSAFEMILHAFVTMIYSIAGTLILQFIYIYTIGIDDVNYIVPLFAFFIILANAMYCLRMSYNIMILAAGHFKQTQNSAIIEATINVVVSVVLVHNYGIVGVAIGTLMAMIYRTTYLAWYLRDNIIMRPFRFYVMHLCVDIITSMLIFIATNWIKIYDYTWYYWIIMAIKKGSIAVIITIVVNVIFYRVQIKEAYIILFKKSDKAR